MTEQQKADLLYRMDCIEVHAKTAAEKPTPLNLIALGRVIEAARNDITALALTDKK